MNASEPNPLLDAEGLPPFSRIRPQHVEPAIDALLERGRGAVEQVLAQGAPYCWASLIAPLEEVDDALGRAWSPVRHLNSVADSPELRTAYNACLPKLSDYHSEIGQNRALYDAYRTVADDEGFDSLDPAQRRTVENALREFELSGVALGDEEKARFRANSTELAELSSRFSENVLDATQAWKKHVTDETALAGMPASALAMAAEFAARDGLDGWLLNLEFPCYFPVITYAENRELRREMYTAYCTRASDQGPHAGQWDNGPTMSRILELRHEQARLLGFDNFAALSLARKMARSTDAVVEFLNDLGERSRSRAHAEVADLKAFASEKFGVAELEAWDVPYYSEKLRLSRYELSQEELRPYFPLPRVLEGLFEIVRRLYDIDIAPREEVDVWHPDVRYFVLTDRRDGSTRGAFFLDLYARADKRGGAWMDECRVRRRHGDRLQAPVAYLTCNFTPPVGASPALLTHDEVTTLFHEFGHGLHHMLTRVDYPEVAGIRGVEWDAVELPSQFMENWCWEREALDLIAGHHETSAALPGPLFEKMIAAKNFQSGMQMVRQLEFALFDFRLHLEFESHAPDLITRTLERVRAEVAVLTPPAFNRFAHGFTHIFGGGYAAGYYSYKWAEVLSSDAFARFEENGIFDRDSGEAFLHCILEAGGSRDAMESFIAFRGREPELDALLRHCGIGDSPEPARATP